MKTENEPSDSGNSTPQEQDTKQFPEIPTVEEKNEPKPEEEPAEPTEPQADSTTKSKRKKSQGVVKATKYFHAVNQSRASEKIIFTPYDNTSVWSYVYSTCDPDEIKVIQELAKTRKSIKEISKEQYDNCLQTNGITGAPIEIPQALAQAIVSNREMESQVPAEPAGVKSYSEPPAIDIDAVVKVGPVKGRRGRPPKTK